MRDIIRERKYLVCYQLPDNQGVIAEIFTATSKQEIRNNLRAAGLRLDSRLSIERY